MVFSKMRFGRLLLSVFLIALAFPGFMQACSCIPPEPPALEFSRADAVFVGKVITLERRDYQLLVTMEVQGSWKGITSRQVDVRTGFGGGDCGYPFLRDGVYLVYAYGGAKTIGTGICTGTSLLSMAASDLFYLRTLPPLLLESGHQAAIPLKNSYGIRLVLVGVIVFVGIAVSVWREQKEWTAA